MDMVSFCLPAGLVVQPIMKPVNSNAITIIYQSMLFFCIVEFLLLIFAIVFHYLLYVICGFFREIFFREFIIEFCKLDHAHFNFTLHYPAQDVTYAPIVCG